MVGRSRSGHIKWMSVVLTVVLTCAGTTAQSAGASGPSDCIDERCRPLESPSGECGRYIVVFQSFVEDPAPLARSQVAKYGGTLLFIYRYALKGYAAVLPIDAVRQVASEPSVKYVEPDRLVTISAGASLAVDEGSCGDGPAPESPDEPTPESTTPPQVPPASDSQPVMRCRSGTVLRGERCVRKRALARRICRKRLDGKATRRCVRRTMRRLARAERQRIEAALRASVARL